MYTSQNPNLLWSELSSGKPSAAGRRAYFEQRTRDRLYDFVLSKFKEQEKRGLTQVELAKRMGTSPAVVNRHLAGPGNWGIDTLALLLLGIAAEELEPQSKSVIGRKPRNRNAQDLLDEQARPVPTTNNATNALKLDSLSAISLTDMRVNVKATA